MWLVMSVISCAEADMKGHFCLLSRGTAWTDYATKLISSVGCGSLGG